MRIGLAAIVMVAACGGGGAEEQGMPFSGDVSGTIATDLTWVDQVTMTGDVTVADGVTVTVDPGTVITAADGVTLRVDGTFDAAGTDAEHVTLQPAGVAWTGIVATGGGSVHLAYVDGNAVAVLLQCQAGAA